MKILAINGSGRKNGNSAKIIEWCQEIKEPMKLNEDVEIKVVNLASFNIRGCIGCEGCAKTRVCVIQDDMQELYKDIEEAEGLILVSPTYFYNITANMKAFIERLYPYELFDPNDRHVWMGLSEAFGLKYAMTIGVCEQKDEKDMGFTLEAMGMPLQSLGYRVVEEIKILNAFDKKDVYKNADACNDVQRGMNKLCRTIALKKSLL